MSRITDLLAAARRGSRSQDLDYDALAWDFQGWMATDGEYGARFNSRVGRWARGRGLGKLLGLGAHRAVFAVPEGVLKLIYSRDYQRSNIDEARVWYEAPLEIREHLVPVLGAAEDGNWLVMERVAVTGKGKLPDKVFERMFDCGLTDLLGWNLSDDGRVLDYGYLWDEKRWRKCALSDADADAAYQARGRR